MKQLIDFWSIFCYKLCWGSEIMTKSLIIDKKNEKKNKLAEAAYDLFVSNGFKNTSIQEIVDKAGVAKGTFYLYFKDKYDLQEYLITLKSYELFHNALLYVDENKITNFYDRIINIIDYLIDRLNDNKDLLEFVAKDLSWGVFGDRVASFMDNSSLEVLDMFKKGIDENNINIKNPDLTLYMIIELTSSTVYSSITKNKPLPIEEFKPYLYKKIRSLLND